MSEDTITPTFGSRYMTEPIAKNTLPEKSMDPKLVFAAGTGSAVGSLNDSNTRRARVRWGFTEFFQSRIKSLPSKIVFTRDPFHSVEKGRDINQLRWRRSLPPLLWMKNATG